MIAMLTGRVDRQTKAQADRSLAVIGEADNVMRDARRALAEHGRRIHNQDRWEHLYAERMADRVDIP